MIGINLQLEDEAYWKLIRLKAIHNAKTWPEFVDIIIKALGGENSENS